MSGAPPPGTGAGGIDGTRRRLPETLADAILAVALLAAGRVGTRPAGLNQPGSTTPDAWCYGLIAAATLALVVRRRWPLATLAVSTVATSAYLVVGYPYGPIIIAYLVAVYTVATRVPLRRAAVAAGASLLVMLVHIFVGFGPSSGLAGVVPGSAIVVVPFALGIIVRLNRESAAQFRVEQARRQADDERLRIAQEVHDVVGHGLAAINMQAEIALHLLPKRPEQAEAALSAISRTSKEALDELRVTLSVVRRGDDRAPAPGLSQVPALTARLAGTGLPVAVTVRGAPRDLPAAVDLAAYRVVQESLTNVLRHAGQATAAVLIGYADAEVTVEVTDTGRGEAPAGPRAATGGGASGASGAGGAGGGTGGAGGRHGLAGMRERVTALGGDLEAGPRPGGGYRVYARLPAERRS